VSPSDLPRIRSDLEQTGRTEVTTLDEHVIAISGTDGVDVHVTLNTCRQTGADTESSSCFEIVSPIEHLSPARDSDWVNGLQPHLFRIDEVDTMSLVITGPVEERLAPVAADRAGREGARLAKIYQRNRWGIGFVLGAESVLLGYVLDLDFRYLGFEAGGFASPGGQLAFGGARVHPLRFGRFRPFLGGSGMLAESVAALAFRAGCVVELDETWLTSFEVDAMRVLRSSHDAFAVGWGPWGGGSIVYRF